MSYSSKTRYKTRREKARIINKNVKKTLVFLAIALAIWIFKYRVAIIDRISTYFY